MKEGIRFQCITWNSMDIKDEETNIPTEYVITMYGKTKENKTITCRTQFDPYFFLEIPSSWEKPKVNDFLHRLKKRIVFKSVDDEWIKGEDHLDMYKSGIVSRKRFFGFTNNESFKFIRIFCKTKTSLSRIINILKKKEDYAKNELKEYNIDFSKCIYEANIEPMLRFMHVKDVKSTGWVECKNSKIIKKCKESTSDIEIECEWNNINPIDDETISKINVASFDIETYSPDESFPDPKNKECQIIQIATSFQRYGEEEPYKRHLLNLGTCDDIKDVEVQCCKNEKDLIRGFVKLIKKENPDIITGYNIWKFDFNYIYERVKLLDMEHEFVIGRETQGKSEISDATFSSSAYGDNDYKMLNTIGITQIDLLELIKREHKLSKYSLNAVSEHFLKEYKIDLPYKEMFKKFKGTSTDRKEIGEYCVQDTLLPLKLITKLNVIPNLVEMAKATWVPINYLLERGQQIKVFSQILYQTRKENMLVRTLYQRPNNDTFIGATVLNAKKGAYMDKVVTGLDFASLYPTIMRAHNLCYNTIVLDDKYKNIKNVEYETIEWDVNDVSKKCIFAQNKQGVLPKLLENLAKNRKEAKKQMNKAHNEGNKFMENVYNGKQLAFKVSMNSIYGFCAAQMLPCPDISASVTTIGRNMIEKTKKLVEEWYPGSEVIYGDTDSVMVIFDTNGLDDKKAIQKSFVMGKEAADKISETFKYPIELEFEKCYHPYLLFSKKRYAGLMYTNPKKPDYIDAKGIQLVRRDNCKLVKDLSKNVLDKIMYEKNIDEGIKLVQKAAKDLLLGKLNIDDLVVSKSLKKTYASQKQYDKNGIKRIPTDPNLPHFTVANKIEERVPGTRPKCGERVPYVFVDTFNAKDLQYMKAEDPNYVKDNNLALDVKYYLEHALTNPMLSLFELFMDNPKKDLFEKVHKDSEVMKETERRRRISIKENNKKSGQLEISAFLQNIN